MSDFYRFPPIVIPDVWTIYDQSEKIWEETREMQRAELAFESTQGKQTMASYNAYDRLIDETMDVIQACETLLRMLGLNNEEAQMFRLETEKKNDYRGYYGEVPDD